MKDITEFKRNHDIIYQGRCPENGYNDHYLEETARGIWERVLDHVESDSNFYSLTLIQVGIQF